MYRSARKTGIDARAVVSIAQLSAHGPHVKDAQAYLNGAYSHFFKGQYDRAEDDCRTAMGLECADQYVKSGLAGLARALDILSNQPPKG